MCLLVSSASPSLNVHFSAVRRRGSNIQPGRLSPGKEDARERARAIFMTNKTGRRRQGSSTNHVNSAPLGLVLIRRGPAAAAAARGSVAHLRYTGFFVSPPAAAS